jgi:tripartite ATP-independent transporter DctP family solute receptor
LPQTIVRLMKQRLILTILGSLTVAVVWTLVSGSRWSTESVVLRLGHSLDTKHPVHVAMAFMADEVAGRSEGSLQIEIYANSQLGSEREMIELVQLGALDLVKTSTSPLEGFVPVMGVFSVPYVFNDDEHFWQVLEGSIGQGLLLASVNQRLRGLCYYDAGSRSFYSKTRPIRTPEDLRGLKIRVQNSRTAMAMVQAMGGAPTPISFGELYTALDQGVVDGAENNPPSFLTSRHYEVCKYYTLDEHTRVPDVLLMRTAAWDRLSPEHRQLLQTVALESADFQRRLWREKTAEALEEVQAAGVEILRPDKGPFQQAVRSLHTEYAGTPVGDLMQQIAALGEAPASIQPSDPSKPMSPPSDWTKTGL